MRNIIQTALALALCFCAAAPAAFSQTAFEFDFANDQQGWVGGFSDYYLVQEAGCELEFKRTQLPAPLDTDKFALKISGKNVSDDLFMFIKKQLTGLEPNTNYKVVFHVEFASQAATNQIGVGGAPGEAVIVKVGAVQQEPNRILSPNGDAYIMNINKANQSEPGPDMDTIGHVGVSDTTTVFTLIERQNNLHPFSVKTDANGAVWAIIGTESGYESTTTLYYNRLKITFTKSSAAPELPAPASVKISPNPAPSGGSWRIESEKVFDKVEICDALGRVLASRTGRSSQILLQQNLPSGAYFVRIMFPDGGVLPKKLIVE